MAEGRETSGPQVSIDVSRSLELVTVASQAQSEKLREVMARVDTLARLNPEGVKNITEILKAARGDGGCGIGCW